jgi:hypothetical protein
MVLKIFLETVGELSCRVMPCMIGLLELEVEVYTYSTNKMTRRPLWTHWDSDENCIYCSHTFIKDGFP